MSDWQQSTNADVELTPIVSDERRTPVMPPQRGATRSESPSPENRTLSTATQSADYGGRSSDDGDENIIDQSDAQKFLAEQAEQEQNFTLRGVLVGLVIGVIICFSNTYFGLQTGWVSGMAMPAALIGFGFFKTVARCIDYPFTPVENVLVQTVAGAVGTMPLGCGFVGVVPALNFLLRPDENGPLRPGLGELIVWSLGLCFFGVVLGVPLRKQVIIREKLKFPSGTATALMIGVVHGNTDEDGKLKPDSGLEIFRQRSRDIRRTTSVDGATRNPDDENAQRHTSNEAEIQHADVTDHRGDWRARIRLLLYAFAGSALYTIVVYFIPQLRSVPIFGIPIAQDWLWSLNPSPAYVGQGIIMGPATTMHMLLGAVVGWGILSPLAKSKGWAPGPVDNWSTGSKGWIVWVSLAIMLADSVVSLGWLVLRPLIKYGPSIVSTIRQCFRTGSYKAIFSLQTYQQTQYQPLESSALSSIGHEEPKDAPEPDAPPHHLVSTRLVVILLILSILLCIFAVRYVFPSVSLGAIILSIIMATLLSLIGVRALGETDLNPVSGISKLSQLFFAAVIPSSNPNAIIINLVAGAISEAGALQAGDILQDLKTGHLLGAAPKAQFYGQMIGSLVGAVVSAVVYKLYVNTFQIPGGIFEVPTAFVWIFTARLVNGKGLPEMAPQFALGASLVFVVLTMLRVRGQGKAWQAFVPGGIAVAVGMYNQPSFTLARTVGGLLNWYWIVYKGRDETPVIVLASGLILGEGLISIVNLGLASAHVPHL